MKYRFISSVVLITLLFIPYTGMAKNGEGEVIHLSKFCQECLLHCAKNRQYDEVSLEWCATKVCPDVCKTEEK